MTMCWVICGHQFIAGSCCNPPLFSSLFGEPEQQAQHSKLHGSDGIPHQISCEARAQALQIVIAGACRHHDICEFYQSTSRACPDIQQKPSFRLHLRPSLARTLQSRLHRVLPGQQHKLRCGCEEGIVQRWGQILLHHAKAICCIGMPSRRYLPGAFAEAL